MQNAADLDQCYPQEILEHRTGLLALGNIIKSPMTIIILSVCHPLVSIHDFLSLWIVPVRVNFVTRTRNRNTILAPTSNLRHE
jgi:hypothetical protein